MIYKITVLLFLITTSIYAEKTSKEEFVDIIKEVPQSDTEVYFNEQIDLLFKDMTEEQKKLLKQIVVGGRAYNDERID